MLRIDDLNVNVKDKKILKNFNIEINDGEVHAIMGPNGTGKSTLSRIIMGDKEYEIASGCIYYNDVLLNELSPDERAKLGIFLSMQNPPTVEGVTNSEFLKTALNSRLEKPIGLYDFIKTLEHNMNDLKINMNVAHQTINKGSSGGERKKNEVLQIKVLKPSFIILDELDSGVDVDNLKIVCENIVSYLEDNPKTSVLIITHYPRILEYIKPDYVHVMNDGKIVQTGDYQLAYTIEKEGYNKAVEKSNEDE